MRVMQTILAAGVAIGVGYAGMAAVTGAPAPVKQARSAASAPLLPLSESDQTSSKETGCTCSMDVRNRILVQAIGNELMLRTRAGRQVCRLTDARFQQISGATGTYRCGGLAMTLRRTGRPESHRESDSYTVPAALTMVQGRTSRTVNGTWGCAC
jgi:hypothetical protein